MISKENAQKLEWLWRDENKIEWIETFIKIVDKKGDVVPFILTPEQRDFVNGLKSKNLVLKSRQLGLSVCTIALSIRACVVRDNVNCLLVSHTQSSTNAIFQKLKDQYNSLPDWLRPETLTNNRQALTFANGSSITCLTAGNKDVGRGSTFNGGIVHLSEFAFWADPERQLNSLMQACSESSTLIIESTANGFNNFSELYYGSVNGENAFNNYFFNWINGSTLFKGQYDQCVEEYLALHNNKMLEEIELDEEEVMLKKLGATMEQLIWRRAKVGISGLDKFHQEYPSTPDEAFVSTGSSVFDKINVQKRLEGIKNIKTLKSVNNLPPILKPYLGNAFTMWKLPRADMRYYIGCDLSEGLGKDSSVVEVFDRDGYHCAEFRANSIKPYEMADIIYALGLYYNKGLLCIERASGGLSVIERLRYSGKTYMNMVKYKSFDQYNREVWVPGFDTNVKTKSLVINDLREWFDKGHIQVNSKTALDEMKIYMVDDSGKMTAPEGMHDDCVMALAMAVVALKSPFYYNF
jgi:hypothetical protein